MAKSRPSTKTRLPRKLEITKIFRLDVDDDLWQEDPGLGSQESDALPSWLSDDKVREGIVAMLEEDRCKEEKEHLNHECVAIQS